MWSPDGNKIATDPDAQMALAEAVATVDECQTIMFRNFDAMVAAAKAGTSLSIDERIKSSVGRITSHPMVQHEVQRIERSIKKLEERLARLRREEVDSSRGGDAVG